MQTRLKLVMALAALALGACGADPKSALRPDEAREPSSEVSDSPAMKKGWTWTILKPFTVKDYFSGASCELVPGDDLGVGGGDPASVDLADYMAFDKVPARCGFQRDPDPISDHSLLVYLENWDASSVSASLGNVAD